MRGGPSISYERVAGINAGTLYKILGKYHTGQSGDIGTWWQIEHPNPDTDSSWVRGDNVVIEDDVSGVRVTWQPYTATLRTGSLALPFASGTIFPITNLFDDLRTRDRYTGLGGRHNGIDWATTGPVLTMAAGRVTAIVDETQGNALGIYVTVQSEGFHITYGHLSEVDQRLVNEYNDTEMDKSSSGSGPTIGASRPDRLLHRRASPCAPESLTTLRKFPPATNTLAEP